MKVFKWLFTIIALIAVGIIIYNWWEDRNYFESGENGNFTLKVGDTFQFQLSENGSTGYCNCWINANHCASVELVDKTYTSSLQEKLGNVGSGGRITFKFKGIRSGVDTVAICNCPTGVERKDCNEFSIDSIKPDNVFIVNIK